MTKFYVESGAHLQVVVTARGAVEAILKALGKAAADQPLRLADVFIVNQRGFVWQRENQQLYGDETVIPTRLLLGEPQQQESCEQQESCDNGRQ